MTDQINKKRSLRLKNTQLVDVMNYPENKAAMKEELKKRLVWDTSFKGTVPGTEKKPITYHKISMGYINDDNTEGQLIVGFDRSFSFGIGENRDEKEDKLTGYSLSMSMYNTEGATERQMRTVQFIHCLSDLAKEHVLRPDVCGFMGMGDVTIGELRKLNPLVYKKDAAGKFDETTNPTFYSKLPWWAEGKDKQGKVKPEKWDCSIFREDEIDPATGDLKLVPPRELIGVRMYVTAAIKFEGIFLGSSVKSMLNKVYEAEIKEVDTVKKRLLKTRSPANIIVQDEGASASLLKRTVDEDVSSSASSRTPSVPSDPDILVPSDDDDDKPESKQVVIKPASPKPQKPASEIVKRAKVKPAKA